MDDVKWPFWYPGFQFWRAPIQATKYWFNNFKAFLRRGRLGWAPIDVWNMDSYMGKILPAMLRHLAANHNGVPMRLSEKYNGDVDKASEKWSDELFDVAKKIEFATAEPDEYNQYAKAHWIIIDSLKSINDPKPIGTETLEDNYDKENKLIVDRQRKAIKEAMAWLGEHWEELWD